MDHLYLQMSAAVTVLLTVWFVFDSSTTQQQQQPDHVINTQSVREDRRDKPHQTHMM